MFASSRALRIVRPGSISRAPDLEIDGAGELVERRQIERLFGPHGGRQSGLRLCLLARVAARRRWLRRVDRVENVRVRGLAEHRPKQRGECRFVRRDLRVDRLLPVVLGRQRHLAGKDAGADRERVAGQPQLACVVLDMDRAVQRAGRHAIWAGEPGQRQHRACVGGGDLEIAVGARLAGRGQPNLAAIAERQPVAGRVDERQQSIGRNAGRFDDCSSGQRSPERAGGRAG